MPATAQGKLNLAKELSNAAQHAFLLNNLKTGTLISPLGNYEMMTALASSPNIMSRY